MSLLLFKLSWLMLLNLSTMWAWNFVFKKITYWEAICINLIGLNILLIYRFTTL